MLGEGGGAEEDLLGCCRGLAVSGRLRSQLGFIEPHWVLQGAGPCGGVQTWKDKPDCGL